MMDGQERLGQHMVEIPRAAMDVLVQWNLMAYWQDDMEPTTFDEQQSLGADGLLGSQAVDWGRFESPFRSGCLQAAAADVSGQSDSRGDRFLQLVALTAACLARYRLQAAVRAVRGLKPEPLGTTVENMPDDPVERFREALRFEHAAMMHVLAEYGEEEYALLLRLDAPNPGSAIARAREWADDILDSPGADRAGNGEVTLRGLLAQRLQ